MNVVKLASKTDAIKAQIEAVRPKHLKGDLRKEFDRVAALLAAPDCDRLKPRYVDGIVRYCKTLLKIRAGEAYFEDNVERMVFESEGRNGSQVKLHPIAAQLNEWNRQLRAWSAALGLSPNDEKHLLTAPGATHDDSEDFFGT